MASSSTNNSNIILKPRLCDCGRTATMYIVRTNDNGNHGCLFFICSSKYSHKEHCNYFKFTNEDEDDSSSTIRSNVGSRKAIRTEELNDIRTRLYEMDNEIHEHGTRLHRIEKNFKIMIYVIVFCVFLHVIM
ncbi:uncharacterized protein LOC114271374 [Camellia sinensis]|uniref:uncharacterized protein LOC114271374 n=1 Tax=Camellia sinensis TaxID=4442 RepID=UPI001035B659|nr:uncharacterized protein LOC114271374 [Camellia sinensis]